MLLVTVDTLRADHLGLYGYSRDTSPNLDRWFQHAAIFERAYSAEANTSPSVVSLLTGRLPQDHGVRLLYQLVPEGTILLPDLLSPTYQTAAFVSNPVLSNEAMGISGRFDHYDDFVDESGPAFYERNARRTTDAVLQWLREHRDRGRPLFLWVHYIDPHGPYRAPGEWPRKFRHDHPRPIEALAVPTYQRDPEVSDGLEYVDRYDEEIRYVDSEIGRLLDAYAAMAPVDQALIVFTADHGESMMDHEAWFTHGHHVYEEIVRVPLMVRGPTVPRGRYSQVTSGIDVAPTILAFTGATPHHPLPGSDLREGRYLPTDRVVFTEATTGFGQWCAAIQHDRKWMVRLAGASRTRVEWRRYDLAKDPTEMRSEASEPSGDVAGMLNGLCEADPDPGGVPATFQKGVVLRAPKVAPRVNDEALDRLRALGYVEE